MKRIAEMQDLNHVIRTLPRLKKHLFNPSNMRSDPKTFLQINVSLLPTVYMSDFKCVRPKVCDKCNATENV